MPDLQSLTQLLLHQAMPPPSPADQAAQDAAATAAQAQMSPLRQGVIKGFNGGIEGLLGLMGLGADTQANRGGQVLGAMAPFIPKGGSFLSQAHEVLQGFATGKPAEETVQAARELLSAAPHPTRITPVESDVYNKLKGRVAIADRLAAASGSQDLFNSIKHAPEGPANITSWPEAYGNQPLTTNSIGSTVAAPDHVDLTKELNALATPKPSNFPGTDIENNPGVRPSKPTTIQDLLSAMHPNWGTPTASSNVLLPSEIAPVEGAAASGTMNDTQRKSFAEALARIIAANKK